MQNYHKHTCYSNIFIKDSAAFYEDYAKRAVELGHKVISSVEHGWQGYYYECFELAQKYGLKFIFGSEAYWVKDRTENDRTNNHIILLAKNESGRRQINSILSEASETGYYYRPRIDLELLLSLNPKDVMITTACIAFWHYDDSEKIIEKLYQHFNESLYLEIQYHSTDSQIALNKKIKELSLKYDIPMIVGMDSHYIYPDDAADREYVLEESKIDYGDEEGWYMDYPDDAETFRRFKEQNVFSDDEIYTAMNNTDILLDFEDISFDKEIKLPVPRKYKDKTKEERVQIYNRLISKKFLEYTKDMPPEEYDRYFKGVQEEFNVYKKTGMCDYPLIDYEIVKRGIEMGGVITSTGRGSAPGFFTNTLCGFSKIDRFVSPIKLYPERFMSETRILETHSLPDIDMNLGTPEIFEKAQEEVMGEGHSYPMIAFGTLKKKASFKMYARAMNMDFELANTISKQIEKYEEDVKNTEDEEEKDNINIYDYVDEQYHSYLDQSKKYWGIIDNKKRAPCAFLLYDGDIRSEIGLIKCKSTSTKKEYITTVIDGAIAERYKFLKNDLLKVNTVLLTDMVYKRIGISPHSVTELSKLVSADEKVWNLYANGYTVGVNQCEQDSTKTKIVRYKPHNISELAAFIAGIRPGFKSMYNKFESREPFSYGIKPLDDLLQTKEFPYSFILYQEQLMAVLNYSGFPMDQCYQIIKDIAKKHPEKVLPLKDEFLKGFSDKIRSECSSDEEAMEMSHKVWQVIYDNTAYGFNSSHAYSMALDSLYGAWQKANHPYEFYEVYLQFYADEGEKEKVADLSYEMQKAFGIKEGKYKWGIDNRKYHADPDNSQIVPSLTGLKGMGKKTAEKLFTLSQKKTYTDFAELWIDINNATYINKGHVDKLIKLDYFSDFGSMGNIIYFNEAAKELYGRSQFNKKSDQEIIEKYSDYITSEFCEETPSLFRKFDSKAALKKLWHDIVTNNLGDKVTIAEKLSYEFQLFGYVKSRFNVSNQYAFVLELNGKYANKIIKLYRLRTGEIDVMKVKGKALEANPIEEGMIIKTIEAGDQRKWRKDDDGNWFQIDETETILYKWSKVK